MSKALVVLMVNTSEGAELRLEVGDHSPIWVIKEELQRETGRPTEEQVLCLLNDKGDEGELLEDDRATLYECGIRTGATLFLSFLLGGAPAVPSPRIRTPAAAPATNAEGLRPAAGGEALDAADAAAAAERARAECRAWCSNLRSRRQAQREEAQRQEDDERYGMTNPSAPASILPGHQPKACILTTEKTPREAEHSFNGVMFDIYAKEPYEISVHSVHVGGMLGTMSVYACIENGWCSDERSLHQYNAYGRQNYAVRDEDTWERVYHSAHKPMWDSTTEIKFDKPIVLLPGTRRGIYVHSALPDDLGLQYQSTGRGNIADENEHIQIIPGVGHTSSVPFDREYGWYRYPRSLTGRLGYEARLRTWAPRYHKQFPDPLKLAVRTMMLAQRRKDSPLNLLPVELVYHVMENCEWNSFGSSARVVSSSDEEEDESPGSLMRRMMGGGARGGGRHRVSSRDSRKHPFVFLASLSRYRVVRKLFLLRLLRGLRQPTDSLQIQFCLARFS